jgi:hypothetical protein
MAEIEIAQQLTFSMGKRRLLLIELIQVLRRRRGENGIVLLDEAACHYTSTQTAPVSLAVSRYRCNASSLLDPGGRAAPHLVISADSLLMFITYR